MALGGKRLGSGRICFICLPNRKIWCEAEKPQIENPAPDATAKPKRGMCFVGLALLAALSTLLICLVFNPLDEVLEQGRYLADYRAQEMKKVVAWQSGHCEKDAPCPLVYEASMTNIYNTQLYLDTSVHNKLEPKLGCGWSWLFSLAKETHPTSLSRFATAPAHPVYYPLRLLNITALLLSLAGLLLMALNRFGIKTLDPCGIFKDMKPPSPAGEAPEKSSGSASGSAASTAAKSLLAALLVGPPVLMGWHQGTVAATSSVQVDTTGIVKSIDKAANQFASTTGRIESSVNKLTGATKQITEAIGGKADQTGETPPDAAKPDNPRASNLIDAIQGMKPQPSATSLNFDSHVTFQSVGGNISDKTGESICKQIGELNQNLQANNTVLNDTMTRLSHLQSQAVLSEHSAMSAENQMSLLCNQLSLRQGKDDRQMEVIAGWLGYKPGEKVNSVMLTGFKSQCCEINRKECGKSPFKSACMPECSQASTAAPSGQNKAIP